MSNTSSPSSLGSGIFNESDVSEAGDTNFGHQALSNSVKLVVRGVGYLKVGQPRIGFVAILMVDLSAFLEIGEECLRNKLVDHEGLEFVSFGQHHNDITLWVILWRSHFAFDHSRPILTGNFVV